jgi:hypothetical protein
MHTAAQFSSQAGMIHSPGLVVEVRPRFQVPGLSASTHSHESLASACRVSHVKSHLGWSVIRPWLEIVRRDWSMVCAIYGMHDLKSITYSMKVD